MIYKPVFMYPRVVQDILPHDWPHMITPRLVRASDLWHITLCCWFHTVSLEANNSVVKFQIRKEEKIYTVFFYLSNIPKSSSLVEKKPFLVSGKDFWTDAFFKSLFLFLSKHIKRFKRTLIYYDTDTQSANFRGNPLCQAYKTTLKQHWNG